MHRVRGKATWLSNPHSDEYLIPEPPQSLLGVLEDVRKQHPFLAQAFFYERPLVLANSHKGNKFEGDPQELFNLFASGAVNTSSVPCGRNTHFEFGGQMKRDVAPLQIDKSAMPSRVTESEQPFECIIRPEYWESLHAPGN